MVTIFFNIIPGLINGNKIIEIDNGRWYLALSINVNNEICMNTIMHMVYNIIIMY